MTDLIKRTLRSVLSSVEAVVMSDLFFTIDRGGFGAAMVGDSVLLRLPVVEFAVASGEGGEECWGWDPFSVGIAIVAFVVAGAVLLEDMFGEARADVAGGGEFAAPISVVIERVAADGVVVFSDGGQTRMGAVRGGWVWLYGGGCGGEGGKGTKGEKKKKKREGRTGKKGCDAAQNSTEETTNSEIIAVEMIRIITTKAEEEDRRVGRE